jgi:hypothetical protein
MTYLFAIAAFVLAFVVMCQWFRNRDLETEVDGLKKANLQLTEENAGYDKRIAELIEGYRGDLRRANLNLAELEGERDALRRRLDNIDWASIADEKQTNN